VLHDRLVFNPWSKTYFVENVPQIEEIARILFSCEESVFVVTDGNGWRNKKPKPFKPSIWTLQG